MREQAVAWVVRSAGLVPVKLAERVRNLANYSLGAGAATLGIQRSGEALLLRSLAADRHGRVTLFDVGAHRGSWTQAALEAFGEGVAVHAFEPGPANFAALQSAVGDDRRVRCHQLAVSDTPGTVHMFASDLDTSIASLHPETFEIAHTPAASSFDVEAQTLDMCAGRLGINRIDLLKIDVEGHELAVLRGAQALLDARAIRTVQFEFGERNLASRGYLRDFVQLLSDFDLFRLTPRGVRPFVYTPADELFLLEANYVAILR